MPPVEFVLGCCGQKSKYNNRTKESIATVILEALVRDKRIIGESDFAAQDLIKLVQDYISISSNTRYCVDKLAETMLTMFPNEVEEVEEQEDAECAEAEEVSLGETEAVPA